jgi:hypothetical protein
MVRKWPETHRGAAIFEFNRAFLDLVRERAGDSFAFGLDRSVRGRLAELPKERLDGIAQTPCLLAGFSTLLPRPLGGVSDGGPTPISPATADTTQIFAVALLTWLRQEVRRDKLLATLCIGPDPGARERLSSAGLRDLQQAATGAVHHLEARFCGHPRIWPDLVRAAASDDPRLMAATRLSVVQLTLVARVPLGPRPGPGGARRGLGSR